MRRASIGIFNPSSLAMHEDLKQIAENPNELLERLLSGVTINGSDEIYEIDKEEFRRNLPALIEPADSSQHSAVVDMLQGDSFVLRGPPGTGKSQTICNMIWQDFMLGKVYCLLQIKKPLLKL